MPSEPVLLGGAWRQSQAASTFQAENPATKERLPEVYPVSSWSDCAAALTAAAAAAVVLRELPGEQLASVLEDFAARIEGAGERLVVLAHAETGLPIKPRLAEAELPRTTNQLRQAASAAREGSWTMPTLDTKLNIRACYAPLGPVCVFGPNNFPFAFNSAAGGDFAAALAAGNPVIAKANSSHPGTSRALAELAQAAAEAGKLPPGTVQLLYRTSHEDGERLVADARVAATGYTGARAAGLKLKAAAERAGRLFYCELSSINPVVVLPGALRERGGDLAAEFATSCLMGAGQFCTNPGLVILLAGSETEAFITAVTQKFGAAPVGTLLSRGVESSLVQNVPKVMAAGAEVLAGNAAGAGRGYSFANTLLRVSGQQFLKHAEALQTEMFGNVSLLVVAGDLAEAAAILASLEGNLTGAIYSDTKGSDEGAYALAAAQLRPRVGRLLNDKMPTGVAVSPAMNHGGPFPATGHPGFTAVGLPAAMLRFAALHCYDNVREPRLPTALRNKNPTGRVWRSIDGRWTQGDVG